MNVHFHLLFVYSVIAVCLIAFSSAEKSKVKSHTKEHVHHEHVAPVVHHVAHPEETTTRSCPEGYWPESGYCVSKTEVPFTAVCPVGTLEEHGKCMQFSPVRYGCPEGGELLGVECLKRLDAPKEIACPHGTTPVNGDCELDLEYPPTCPDGTALVGHQCVRISPIHKVCPSGFVPHGAVCMKKETHEPFAACPEGMVLRDDSCVIETVVEPICPPGTADEGDQCVTFQPKVSKCPPSYALSDSICVRTSTQPRKAWCANGADPDDNCRVVINVPLSPTCPKGTLLIDHSCQTSVTNPAMLHCPEEYILQGSHCVKNIEYDCSVTTYEIECEEIVKPSKESHLHVDNEHHDKHHRQLSEKDHAKAKHVHEHQPVHHEAHHHEAPILPVCHKVPMTTPKTCEKTVEAEAAPHCPEGTLVRGNACEFTVMEPAMEKCGGKVDQHGNCYVEETSSPLYRCPHGYSGGPQNTCTRIETADKIFDCPHGTVGPHCAVYSPRSCPNGSCDRAITESPIYLCPEGYVKTSAAHTKFFETEDQYYKGVKGKKSSPKHTSHHHSGRTVCEKVVYVNLHAACPSGLQPVNEASCASFVEMIVETKTHRMTPERTCPSGYAHEDRRCVLSISNPASPICPGDAFLDNGRCAKHAHMHKECPEGSISEKGSCWVFRKAEPITVDTVVEGVRKHTHTPVKHESYHHS